MVLANGTVKAFAAI